MATYTATLRERLARLRIERAMRERGEDPRTFIQTGLRDFDEHAGIERSILTVIGAPSGEGKSIFKKHVQEHSAQRGLKCLDFSMEDPPGLTADRTFSTLTGIDSKRIGRGDITEADLHAIAMELVDAEWADLIEYHYGLRTPEDVLEIAKASGADLIQVDYAQAFADGSKGLERTIADLAWKLNELAQETGAAVVVYSQLKPEVEMRGVARAENTRRYSKDGDGRVDIEGFRPFGLSDIAWASSLGQRAKGIGYLFRPNRYRRRYGEDVPDNRMELIWPKKNFGTEGVVVVGFDGATARLHDLKETA